MLDFQGEMLCSLNASDISTFVVNGVNGLEIGAEVALDYSSGDHMKSKCIVVNMLDRDQANFNKVLNQLKERFGRAVFPFMLPANEGESFNQVVDILKKKMLTFKTDGSGAYDESDLSGDYTDSIPTLNEEFIELIAESDEALLEKFFEDGELSEDDIKGGLSAAILNGSVIPVFCSSSTGNIGVKRTLSSRGGSEPKYFDDVLGLIATNDFKMNDPITIEEII